MLLPGPGAAVLHPVASEPGKTNGHRHELKPAMLETEDGAQGSADSADGDHGGAGGAAVKVAENVVVEGDCGECRTCIGHDCANEERPLPVLGRPKDDGEESEPEQMG